MLLLSITMHFPHLVDHVDRLNYLHSPGLRALLRLRRLRLLFLPRNRRRIHELREARVLKGRARVQGRSGWRTPALEEFLDVLLEEQTQLLGSWRVSLLLR